MIAAWLSYFEAMVVVAAVAAGIVGAHYYITPAFTGFQIFALGFLLSIVGVIFGLIGIIATRSPQKAGARPRAIFGIVINALVALPVVAIIAGSLKYPPINDITTDFDNPPGFEHAAALPANRERDMKYDAAKYRDRQRAGYSDLAPLKMASGPEATFAKVEAAAKQMPAWEVTAEYPKTYCLEGVETSPLFHFHDDFVIQVRPATEGGGSLVEMRSKSRDGIGDFGMNYKRIKAFFAKLGSGSEATS